MKMCMRHSNRRPWLRRGRRGIAIVEFALISVIFLLPLVMAIIEYGWMMKNNLQIANATRDACRMAATGSNLAGIRGAVEAEAIVNPSVTDGEVISELSIDGGGTWTALTDSTVNTNQNAASAGNLVRVTVNYPYRSITHFWSFLNSGHDIQGQVVMRRE